VFGQILCVGRAAAPSMLMFSGRFRIENWRLGRCRLGQPCFKVGYSTVLEPKVGPGGFESFVEGATAAIRLTCRVGISASQKLSALAGLLDESIGGTGRVVTTTKSLVT
jgi:hypothetical protein